MTATPLDDRAQALRRVERELRRLEALAARRRIRVRVLRFLRGSAGAATTFGALLKLKLAGSLAVKLALAALVGLGLAWPLAALAILTMLGVLLAIVSLISGEGGSHDLSCNSGCDCADKERRAERLRHSIERRRAWLASPSEPAPSLRLDGTGPRSVVPQSRRR